jgi:hypothetical protein
MNLRGLQQQISQVKEIAIIGRNAEISGAVCHVMGLVLSDCNKLQMLVLQYDEAYRSKLEESEIADLSISPVERLSNRMQLCRDRNPGPAAQLSSIEKVRIGGLELTSHESSSGMCRTDDWDKLVLFSHFLINGWNPGGIDTQELNALFFTALSFDGTYESIPAFDAEAQIHFNMRQNSGCHLVGLPVTLSVGSEYAEKLYFFDKVSGKQHWAQINKVTLCDIWAEVLKAFDNPQMTEHFSPEHLNRQKAEFEKHLAEICPKGMCYMMIEYECEEEVTLQFYSKRWLDAKTNCSSSLIGFIMKPDEPTGKLGMKLKSAVIQDPLTPDTTSIEAELFQYIQGFRPEDIIMP